MQTTFTETEYRNQIPWFIPDKRQMVLDMLAGWEDLTNKYSCNLAQLVIAWTVMQPGITFALCGARKPEHSTQNAAAGDINLELCEIQKMRSDVEVLGQS